MLSNGGIHCHLFANVSNLRRWKSVKDKLKLDHRVSVHFSEKSLSYVVADRYVCKFEKDVLHNADHPDLQTIGISPITKKCMQANNKKTNSQKRATLSYTSTSAKTQNKNKTKKLGYNDVAEYVLDTNIKNLKELQSIASKTKNEGEKDLVFYLKTVQKMLAILLIELGI